MKRHVPRKFTILDGMILVAAAAGGLGLSRVMGQFAGYYSLPQQNWLGRNLTEGAVKLGAGLPFLITLTPAVLLMRLRRPRPRWRRLARQPGITACAAAIVPIVVALLRMADLAWRPEPDLVMFPRWEWSLTFWDCGFNAGLWVLAAWLALALSGRRRSERSGIDRLGRTVGAGWLMILVIQLLGTATPGQ